MSSYATPDVPARRERPSFSIPSILAGVCALLVFFTEGFDPLLGIAAIVLGLIGAVVALAPSVRGGIVSIASIVIGLFAIVFSVFQVIF
jgi:hypothetical protein